MDVPVSTYFRGCGRPVKELCHGDIGSRPPSRSTAGQGIGVNGVGYCEWGTRVSQCKSCCVTDHCNGAQLMEETERIWMTSSANSLSYWSKINKCKSNPLKAMVCGPFMFTSLVILITMIVAFPRSTQKEIFYYQRNVA